MLENIEDLCKRRIRFSKFKKGCSYMQEKIKIEEFKEYIDRGELNIVFDKIADKSIELIKKIATMKGLSLEGIENIEDRETLFYYFEKLFEENSAYFQAIPDLMRNFAIWNIELIDGLGETKEEKIEMYIQGYNLIIYELEEYEFIKNEIQKKGYEKLKNQKIKKLISAFKEMLDYKHKSYNDKWSFEEWIEVIDKYYHFYHDTLKNTLTQIQSNTLCRWIYMDYQVYIKTDDVENLIALDDLYCELDPETGDYKDFADFYEDIELEEGQTYEDLYNEKIEKFVGLFKEMLDYINVEHEENSFEALKALIRENFPYYSDNITSLSVRMGNPTETYISLLSGMDSVYNYFVKTYKNHEENLKKYEEEMKNDGLDEELEFIDEEE